MTINLIYGSSFQIISLTELEKKYHTSQACEKWSQDITLARKQKDAERMQRLLENKNDKWVWLKCIQLIKHTFCEERKTTKYSWRIKNINSLKSRLHASRHSRM
ncbi:hypothetical protein VIGAN_10047800 [Vigna angularis var. angularis]|uniref:Uncharacterized protein n=1 Tax=Vigna angularis var. angularis TaxID=157739 RepID=A0A0S3T1J9_PHAAN|nr:hypothetical protein VIGAN_10047800 [Vigna angularis var. angularis]